jgi:hypothetical protein
MTETAPPTSAPAARRRTTIPRLIAFAGLLGIVVLWGFELQALTWESGDRVLRLSEIGVAVASVTTVAATIWTIWAPKKAGAIVVLVISVLVNPIWLFLLIRALG